MDKVETKKIDGDEKIAAAVELFDAMEGYAKLELIKILIEKAENGEIELDGTTVYLSDIGIADGYACCSMICSLIRPGNQDTDI